VKRLWALIPIALFAAIAAAAIVALQGGGGKKELWKQGMIGRPAPAISLPALRGDKPVTLAAYRGQTVVVNFFASWCTPCRLEHPLLLELKAAGVPILGVAYKDKPEDATRLLGAMGDPFAAVGLDPEGRLGLDLGVVGVPETLVIGPDGNVLALHRGPLTPEAIAKLGLTPKTATP
jgi:cytochrome c biogenesis protein CcmG/thiol:disulfide interchange protein DsbE